MFALLQKLSLLNLQAIFLVTPPLHTIFFRLAPPFEAIFSYMAPLKSHQPPPYLIKNERSLRKHLLPQKKKLVKVIIANVWLRHQV